MNPFRCVAFFGFAVLCGAQSSSRPSADLPPALVRHLAWSGGAKAWQELETLRCSGRLARQGLEGPIDLVVARDGRVRVEFELGPMRGAEGADAAGTWRRGRSGQVEAMPAEAAQWQAIAARCAFGGHFFGALGPWTARGQQEHAGGTYDVVRAHPAADQTLDLLFAPDGELRWRRSERAGKVRWTELSEYRAVAGVKVAFRERSEGDGDQLVTWRSIEANPRLPGNAFSRDLAARRTGVLPDGAATVVIPLELHADRYLYAQGSLAGTATDIVVDSGAGITVVDRALAERAGLRGGAEIMARGVGAKGRPVQLAQGVSLRLGEVELTGLTVAILDLGEVHERVGRPMPVILGKELFHAYTVEVDYAHQRLRIHDPARYVAPEQAFVAPTRPLPDGHVMIEMRFEDLPPAWFMVDTGSGDTLALHHPYVAEHRLLARYPRLGERRIGGVGGTLPAKVATADAVSLAGHAFTGVPVVLATEKQGAFASAESAGTLGAVLLQRFTVTFDYPRQRLLFVPGTDLDRPFPKDRLGLSVATRDGVVVVEAVAAGSAAARAGVRTGDQVRGVGAVTGDAGAIRVALRDLARQPAGTEATLQVGEQRLQFALAEYY